MAGISHGTTDQAAMDSSTKTIFMRCMKALNMIVFFRKCAHRVPSRPLHLWSVAGRRHTALPLCFLPFALHRERYLSGRYWRADPYLYGSKQSAVAV